VVFGLVGLFYAHPTNGGAAGIAINALVCVEVILALATAVYTLRSMRASTHLDPKSDAPAPWGDTLVRASCDDAPSTLSFWTAGKRYGPKKLGDGEPRPPCLSTAEL
jgi:hypothetical protein